MPSGSGYTGAFETRCQERHSGPGLTCIAPAKTVGKLIAEQAQAIGVKKVVFDRGGYLYHGRIKALAEAAREAGLEF